MLLGPVQCLVANFTQDISHTEPHVQELMIDASDVSISLDDLHNVIHRVVRNRLVLSRRRGCVGG